MTKDDVLFESINQSIQAFAMAKAIKRMVVPQERQEEFVQQYKACLHEIFNHMQNRHPELTPIIQKLISQETSDCHPGQ